MAKKIIVFLAFFLLSCEKPIKIYECEPGEDRTCKCLNGEIGDQECSRGPAFTTWTPREWIPCSCCWTVLTNEHGPYYMEKNDASGCWTDVYDPSTPTYDIGRDNSERGGPSDG